MKGQLKASTPEEYIAQLKEPRKSDIAALDTLVRKTTKLEPFIQMGILAYGPVRYTGSTGREADWFRIGIASNAAYISLYVWGTGIGDAHRAALPKANICKGCVRFKKLADLDAGALKKLLKEGDSKDPGSGLE